MPSATITSQITVHAPATAALQAVERDLLGIEKMVSSETYTALLSIGQQIGPELHDGAAKVLVDAEALATKDAISLFPEAYRDIAASLTAAPLAKLENEFDPIIIDSIAGVFSGVLAKAKISTQAGA